MVLLVSSHLHTVALLTPTAQQQGIHCTGVQQLQITQEMANGETASQQVGSFTVIICILNFMNEAGRNALISSVAIEDVQIYLMVLI